VFFYCILYLFEVPVDCLNIGGKFVLNMTFFIIIFLLSEICVKICFGNLYFICFPDKFSFI
jgi:hypothetical protein